MAKKKKPAAAKQSRNRKGVGKQFGELKQVKRGRKERTVREMPPAETPLKKPVKGASYYDRNGKRVSYKKAITQKKDLRSGYQMRMPGGPGQPQSVVVGAGSTG